MRKLITFVICMMTLCMPIIAQNYEEISITTINGGSTIERCSTYDSIRINQDETCPYNAGWTVCNMSGTIIYFDGDANHITLTPEMDLKFHIFYTDCYTSKDFSFNFFSFESIPEPWAENEIWLSPGETRTLEVYYSPMLNYLWPDGSTNSQYTITGPENSGKLWVRMYNDCGSVSDTINVYYNTEPATATVDPNTNKNLVVWEITPEQAEYISNVIINRDGVDMATVPYTDGQYLDNIGSDLAARVYTLKAVCPDGTQCPFPSRQRGTIHMAFLPDINGNVEMTWNQPILDGAPIHVNRFEICEYDPNSNEINVIDFVSSVTTSYSCNQSMFDYGYPLIRAVIQDGRGDKDMLSNRTEDLVGLNEKATGMLRVYPNPSSSAFNIAINGETTLTIYNQMGQAVVNGKTENGVFTVSNLPSGVYFVKSSEGCVQKVVVE